MSDTLQGVVVSHAKLGAALVDAVREITGREEALVAVSNEGCSRALLNDRLEEAVHATPSVVFVDLPGGCCLHAALGYLHGHPGVAVVAGVNLAMLVDFVYHRDLSPPAAAQRAAEVGGRAVKVLS